MSWVVEQSDDASGVQVNGNTVTCRKDGYYGSPINVLYKDPADHNGDYFWEIQVQQAGDESGGPSVSVGVTREQSFQSGWALKAMKYLGNLSDGSALLVQQFGEQIKQGDKIGILLRLSNADMKMYLFHNDRPLGLAFHINAPYPKPLFPVVSFDANGQVKITRSQQIPTGLDRGATQYHGVEGTWKIVEYAQHPECVGSQFELTRTDQNQYRLHTRVVNNMNCHLEHNSTTNQWKPSPVMSTMMMGPPELMQKERIVNQLISGIQHLDVDSHQNLILQTNSGENVSLQRFTKAGPPAVTENIFA